MVNQISVKMDIDDCVTGMNNLLRNYDILEKKLETLTAKIDDTSKWKGEAQVKANNIHLLICQYAKSLHDICIDHKKNLIDLRDSADSFADDSYNVSKLKAW